MPIINIYHARIIEDLMDKALRDQNECLLI